MFVEIFVTLILLIAFAGISLFLYIPNRSSHSPIIEKSHAFHEPVGEYEEDHLDRIGSELIRHPEAEAGYVVLNGVKRKLEDCKNL